MRNGRVRAVTASEFPPVTVTVGMEGLLWDPDVVPQTARHLRNEALKRVASEGVAVPGDAVQGSAAAVLRKAGIAGIRCPVQVSVNISLSDLRDRRFGPVVLCHHSRPLAWPGKPRRGTRTTVRGFRAQP